MSQIFNGFRKGALRLTFDISHCQKMPWSAPLRGCAGILQSHQSLARISFGSARPPSDITSRSIKRARPSRHYSSTRHSSAAPASAPTPFPSSSKGPTPSAGGPQAPLEYCASLVQRLDPEAWLCSYFWPKRERAWFLAWRAFNVSIYIDAVQSAAVGPSLIQWVIFGDDRRADRVQLELHLVTTSVSQPALASIRFQFWRDALKAIFSKEEGAVIPQHPVVVLLAEMRRERQVQKYYLSQLIDTRVCENRSGISFRCSLCKNAEAIHRQGTCLYHPHPPRSKHTSARMGHYTPHSSLGPYPSCSHPPTHPPRPSLIPYLTSQASYASRPSYGNSRSSSPPLNAQSTSLPIFVRDMGWWKRTSCATERRPRASEMRATRLAREGWTSSSLLVESSRAVQARWSRRSLGRCSYPR